MGAANCSKVSERMITWQRARSHARKSFAPCSGAIVAITPWMSFSVSLCSSRIFNRHFISALWFGSSRVVRRSSGIFVFAATLTQISGVRTPSMSRHAMTGLIGTEEVLRPFLSLGYPASRARSFRFSRDGRRFVHEQPIELDLPHGLGTLL